MQPGHHAATERKKTRKAAHKRAQTEETKEDAAGSKEATAAM